MIVLDAKLLAATPLMAGAIAVGLCFAVLTPLIYQHVAGSLVSLTLAALCMFTTSAATNIALMAAVPPANRPFAIALATIIQHALGDVPSPTLIGIVADDLSPVHADPDSGNKTRSKEGLQITLLIVFAWLLWAVLCWTAAYLATRSRVRRHQETGFYWKDKNSLILLRGETS
jgi:hypothetical protein